VFCALLASAVLPGIARADTVPFAYVAVGQAWTVPAGVTSATFDAYGAQGGSSANNSGGKGAHARATIGVTPGETLIIYVGGTGGVAATGFNGGGKGGTGSGTGAGIAYRAFGGGGATDVRRGGTALANRLMVAAGGGGASQHGAGGNSGAGGGGGSASGGAATGTTGGPPGA
jgi:Glycine rich protein